MSMTATKRRRLRDEKERDSVLIGDCWYRLTLIRDRSEQRDVHVDSDGDAASSGVVNDFEIRIRADIPAHQAALKVAQAVSLLWKQRLARQLAPVGFFPRE